VPSEEGRDIHSGDGKERSYGYGEEGNEDHREEHPGEGPEAVALERVIGDKEGNEEGHISFYLKDKEYGYTVFEGHGSTEKMNMILIVIARKEASKVLRDVRKECDGKVFVVASDVSKYAGGYGMLK
jgi:hypothetical protein